MYAKYANPALEMKEAGGKMCEPRLKRQRIRGSEREAGCDWRAGMSKRERLAMPPEAIRAVEMLRVWMRVVDGVVDMLDMDGCWVQLYPGLFDC